MKNIISTLAAFVCSTLLAGCAALREDKPLYDVPVISKDLSASPTLEAISAPTIPPSNWPKMQEYELRSKNTPPPEVPQPVKPMVLDAKELECMSKAMYFEARGEKPLGQYAVGYVVLNRTADPRFPNTVCDVIHQGEYRNGKPVLNRCQFSFHCDGRPDHMKPVIYEQMKHLAQLVMRREVANPIGKALYFHATHVVVNHKRRVVDRKPIGNHVFYAFAEPAKPKQKMKVG